MTRHIVFLRGINVGGKNIIPMRELVRIFEFSGYRNVQTFIQSGNVIFDSEQVSINSPEITAAITGKYGYSVDIFPRTFKTVEKLLIQNPFGNYVNQDTVKCYVSFLSAKPKSMPPLPLTDLKEGLELVKISGNHAFVLSREIKGRYGFPNNFIEAEFGIPATTRNWTTIMKIVSRFKY